MDANYEHLMKGINANLSFNELVEVCKGLKYQWITNNAIIDAIQSAELINKVFSENVNKLIELLKSDGTANNPLVEDEKYVTSYISALTSVYKYRKLPKKLSYYSRLLYEKTIPVTLLESNCVELYSLKGVMVSTGYSIITIGDYGAYIEVLKDQMVRENICVKKGEEYRYREAAYVNKVKYYWYTSKDSSDIKIYYQQRTVDYADYKPSMFYISPFEVALIPM